MQLFHVTQNPVYLKQESLIDGVSDKQIYFLIRVPRTSRWPNYCSVVLRIMNLNGDSRDGKGPSYQFSRDSAQSIKVICWPLALQTALRVHD